MATQRDPASGSRASWVLVVCLLVLSTLLVGCVTGEGPVKSETREIRPFSELEVGAGIHVVMTIGPIEHLEVSAQANILDAIGVNVSGRVLKIDAATDFTSTEPVTVTVTGPGLDRIAIGGGAEAVVNGLHVDALQIFARGGSRIAISGTAATVMLSADGGSISDLADLSADTVDVAIDGAAAATIRAAEIVTGRASGGARLDVLGDAQVTVDADGGATVSDR